MIGKTVDRVIHNIDVLVTMDSDRRVIKNGWIAIDGNRIEALGGVGDPQPAAASYLDAKGHIVLPGLVNTHHHFFQTLLHVVPSFQNKSLWYWLQELYLPMKEVTNEMNYISTRVALAELILSGCTTAQDHSYICVNDMTFETQIRAAQEMGVRFHLSRGSLTMGQSEGSIATDEILENEDDVLANCEDLINKHHQRQPGGMTRIEIAPVSLFSGSPDFLKKSAALARKLGVGMHTHCYESQEEEDFCVETYGKRPVQFAADNDWVGPDTWYAHAVRHNAEEVALMGKTGNGVAHCPSSNMRLASGIAPVVDYLAHGVRVGLGCDGSASNDSSHMLAEARMALLLQRCRYGAESFSGTDALEIATLGGAQVLGRDDIASLEPGKMADIIGFDLNTLGYAGAMHDPIAALVFCQPDTVSFSLINGRLVVENKQLIGVNIQELINEQNRLADELIKTTTKRYNHDFSTRIWRKAIKNKHH